MDGVGGGVAVSYNQSATLIEVAPVLLIGRIAVHGKKRRGGKSIHIAGVLPQIAIQVLLDHGGRGLSIPGEVDLPEGCPLLFEMAAQELGLGGLAGAVRSFKYDQFSAHFFRFSCLTCTKKRGSFIMRPMRLGSLQSR